MNSQFTKDNDNTELQHCRQAESRCDASEAMTGRKDHQSDSDTTVPACLLDAATGGSCPR